MEGFPKEGTKEEILTWLRGKAPGGTLFYQWKNEPGWKDTFVENQSINQLRSLIYIPELKRYATPNEIVRKIPHNTVSKTVQILNNNLTSVKSHTFPNNFLLDTIGSLPPYILGNTTPDRIERLEDFDTSILLPLYPELPASLNMANIKYNANMKTAEQRTAYLQMLRERIETKKREYTENITVLLQNPDIVKKLKALQALIHLKFQHYGDLPAVYNDRMATVGKFHGLLGSDSDYGVRFSSFSGWKQDSRLSTDSKQLTFAREVGGLIVYLLTQLPKEFLLNIENSQFLQSLFHTYSTELLYTTTDGIAITNHLEKVANLINEYVGYNLIVIDCAELTGQCSRGVLTIPTNDGTRYHLVFTDVDSQTEITPDNFDRLWQLYSQRGGKRRTQKHIQKKKKGKSRRWRKVQRL